MESKWEYKECFSKGSMEDDYSGHYEVTNGEISLCTNDDPEDITETENTLQRVANVLNESGCKFYCNTTTEHKMYIENMLLHGKYDELKERAEKMEDALKEILKQRDYYSVIDLADKALARKEGKEAKDESK
jgi:hypothetical protein